MKIIAHRGDSRHFVENSLSAIEGAINAGAKYIECDVQEAEGEFYIFHDFNLERMCNLHKRFSHATKTEIESLQLPNNEQIPTLAQLCDCVGENAVINLEIKHLLHVQSFVDALALLRTRFNVKVVISSFEHKVLLEIRSLMRGTRDYQSVKYGALIAHLPADLALYAHKLDVDIAAIEAEMVTKEFVMHAHSLSLEVWCYTVNDDWLYDELNVMGVDAIFTDDPKWALNQQSAVTTQ